MIGVMLVLSACDGSGGMESVPNEQNAETENSESLPDEIASRDWVSVPLDSLVAHGLADAEAEREGRKPQMEKYTSALLNTPSSDFTFTSTGTTQSIDASFELNSLIGQADYVRWFRGVTVESSCGDTETLYYQSDNLYGSTSWTDPFSGSVTLDQACDHTIEAFAYEDHYFYGYGWVYESASTHTVTADYQAPPPPVVISGPLSLDSGQSGTWTADVNFGSGTTTYQWYYRRPNELTWRTGGTGSSYTHTFYGEANERNLAAVKVDVTRGGQTESGTYLVTILTDCVDDEPARICPILD